MDDLIDRQVAIDSIQYAGKIGKQTCISILKRLPSAQPEIIRCSECKYSRGEPIADGRYWCIESCGYFQFCSEAERKENG